MISFLGAFGVAAILCAVCCALVLRLFPWFRSGEHKDGNFTADQSSGVHYDPTKKGSKKRTFRVSPNELPLVGGPALVIATVASSLGFAFWLGLDDPEWKLMGLVLLGVIGYGLVGFVDDWRKVHHGAGITEVQKFVGMLIVSIVIGVVFNREIVTHYLSAWHAYPPYSDIPLIGKNLLVDTPYAWVIFFIGITMVVGVTTPLAVDFADGMDGLCGGLLVSASLAFAVILLYQNQKDLWPLIVVSLAVAGASVGYLPFNWPSAWGSRSGGRKRRARLIMGDTGSLGVGGALALVAVISRLELLLLIIGGVFVLEGLSALISARILVKFFLRFLFLERFGATKGFPHTEFPLPFLATPMHHHYDLLNWNRERLVYLAWLLGALLGLLGVASVTAPLTWERYLARFAALLVLVAIWQFGPSTKLYFLGLALNRTDAPNSPRRLRLFYGYPYKLFGRQLYHCVDLTSVRETALMTPVEDLSLWQRFSVFDARSLLGYYCYRAGALDDAWRVWDRLPRPNLGVRPEIAELLNEVKHQIAFRDAGAGLTIEGEPGPVDPADPGKAVPGIWRHLPARGRHRHGCAPTALTATGTRQCHRSRSTSRRHRRPRTECPHRCGTPQAGPPRCPQLMGWLLAQCPVLLPSAPQSREPRAGNPGAPGKGTGVVR